jgi:hypothetical protein
MFMILRDKLMLASYMDLTRTDTIQLVQSLVSTHVLTQERADQILNAAPADIEIYRG